MRKDVSPTVATNPSRRPRVLTIVILAVFFFGLPFLGWLATLLTDYLWFVDLGQQEVFITTWASRLATGALFGVIAFALLYVNARIARSMAPRTVLTSVAESIPDQFEEIVSQLRGSVGPIVDRVVLWGSVGLAFFLGAAMSANWDIMRLALAAVPYGLNDPQFGRDISFFVFTLPALRAIADWATIVLVLTALFTAVVHLVDGAIQPWARLKGFAPHVKAHLSVLLGLIVASKAFDYYLSVFELNFSPRGQVTGASYTDVNASFPRSAS
jgi:uncharacterized protein